MPKNQERILGIESSLPTDWAAATPKQMADVKAGLFEILHGMGCCCNGTKRAVDSVAITIKERIRALAISKRVDAGVRDLAVSKGIDVGAVSQAVIVAASSPEEINSLLAFESIISADTISQTVSEVEMAAIQTQEIGQSRDIRDANWEKDLSQFVQRSIPHQIYSVNDAGLAVTATVGIKLGTLVAEVDHNGEICAWIYEES